MRPLTSSLACMALRVVLAILSPGASVMAAEPVWGATYFSAWNDGNKQVATMNHPEWYNRAPFYAELQSSEPYRLRIDSGRQAIMDQEILYASAGGLDYWAFYSTTPAQDDRDRYLASRYKKRLRWCQIQGWMGGANGYFRTNSEDQEIARLVGLFRDAQYLRLGDRPVFMWYLPGGDRDPDTVFGSYEKAQAFLARLAAAARAAGMGAPYVVIQKPDAGTGARMLGRIGADAITAYAVGGTDFQAVNAGCAGYWQAAAQAAAPIVPPLVCGWAGPHVKNWNGPPPYDDSAQPTMPQWRKQLEDARDFVRAHPAICPGGLTLIYNWSEYGEGGWLNADKSDGVDKLSVLRSVKDGVPVAVPWNFTFTTGGWTADGLEGAGLGPKRLDGVRLLVGLFMPGRAASWSLADPGVRLQGLTRVVIRLRNGSARTRATLRFATDAGTAAVDAITFPLTADDAAFREYDLDLAAHAGWRGALKRLTLEIADGQAPVAGDLEIDAIRLEPPARVPAAPADPYPANATIGVSRATGLAWTPCAGAVSYDVYGGTAEPLALLRSTSGVHCEPGPLPPGTRYSWRLVARTGSHATTGTTWTFTTGP